MRGFGRSRRRLAIVSSLLAVGAAVSPLTLGGSSGAATSSAVDHFECYRATVVATQQAPKPFSHTPRAVRLRNTLTANAFTVTPGAPNLQCNPAAATITINGHTATTTVKHANAHLLCRSVSRKGLALPAALHLTNEFGTGTLRPTALRSICLPSWATQTTPPKFPATNAPASVDAYACYSVVHPNFSSSFTLPAKVRLKDQFAAGSVHLTAANMLCAPTSKTLIASAAAEPAFVDAQHFAVCFAASATTRGTSRVVYDRNQFGIGALAVTAATEFCVPSTKAVTPPSTTTTKPAPSTTSTTMPSGTLIDATAFMSVSIAAPFDITSGPDGALWFTNGDNDSIGRITTTGAVTNFTDASVARPDGIAPGPDGALWFTNAGNNSIGRITTAGVITHFSDPTIKAPFDIVAGSDGALWFTNYDNNTIGRITTTGVITNYTSAGAPTGHGISFPDGIASGPDGALWFANTGYGTIGRITTAGVVTNFSDPTMASPYRIAAGPDGAMWFSNGGNNSIGRITTAGAVTNFTNPSISSPQGLVAAPDGAMWFANFGNNSIGRITTAGVITNYFNPMAISGSYSITVGPDGLLWYTNSGNDSIGRLSSTP